MDTLIFKKILLVSIVIFVFLLVQPFTWAQKNSTTIGKKLKTDSRPPSAQVVNNSGENIYQAKVGNMVFSRHIGTCSDGCSTGFKNVNIGSNIVSIKIEHDSPWVVIGTLNGFEKNKHYAVNLVKGPKNDQACAILFLRHKTSSTFNSDRTKEKIGKACTILPDNATKRPPQTQVVNNSGINIYQAKVGNVFFSRHIGSCSDGCSTGFKKVNPGSNRVSVKINPASPWAEIGTLNGFKNNKHYAVNFVAGRGGMMCVELYLRHDTDPYFNDDHTKEIKGSLCNRLIPLVPVD